MANQSEYAAFPDNSHNDSGSYVEEKYVPYHLRPETYIVPVVFGIIFIAGVVGNGSLLMMFCRHKDMRSAPNMLIFKCFVTMRTLLKTHTIWLRLIRII